MLELGKRQNLKAVKKVDFGMYLASPDDAKGEERVLLPLKQVPPTLAIGDEINVFLYKDSSDRLIATVKEVLITLGEVARLRVSGVTKIGAFLDWGLEKELLLPFREQTYRVREEEEVLVALYVDKTGRLCATMKLYPYLTTTDAYAKDDKVDGTLYEISENFGAFVAIDDKYQGLIPAKEFTKDVPVGSRITARVTSVHEDGKINLSIREKAYLQIETDA
ncbi:MAG: S1 RNA-binding domain-containing protein, partial [Lachnospiraceae bacterium]|nr:S1 RNA-binding domain-containing protein [Lachnospiraceae bacterium]